MTRLDDTAAIRKLDPGNMYNRIFDLPEQISEALKLATAWEVDHEQFDGARNIVVIGMGGSAIGGDLIRTLLAAKLMIPFQICRNYSLPEYVDDETVVIASSYSGNTEETLSALEDALNRKSMIVAISTGGLLEQVAERNAITMLKIPGGLQPRAAIGFSFVPALVFLEKIGLARKISKQIEATAARLASWREQYIEDEPAERNRAKRLALQLHGRIPIIYGGPSLTDVVAVRWKGQICENAKNMAFANVYPELNHNELVGWSDTVQKHKDHLVVVQLHSADDHPKITRRMEIVSGIIQKQGVPLIEINSVGNTPLERMFSLIQLGDFVSYYLAVLNKVDPTPVQAIETLKRELAE